MPSFGELQAGSYYLIQVDEESDIELVSLLMQTRETVLLRSYLPAPEDFFRYSDENIYKVVEELDEEAMKTFGNLYREEDQSELFEFDEEE